MGVCFLHSLSLLSVLSFVQKASMQLLLMYNTKSEIGIVLITSIACGETFFMNEFCELIILLSYVKNETASKLKKIVLGKNNRH